MLFIALLMLVSVLIAIGIRLEKKWYNNGICIKCGEKLINFDTDSQGGRGYCCTSCGYHTWVSYKCVDFGSKRGI